MPDTVMTLLTKLGLDASGFSAGLKSARDEADVTVGNIVNRLGSIGRGVAVAGLGALVAGAGAAGAALASCIGPASDLSETVNKVNVVFGEQADRVFEMAERSAKALGMTKNEALSAAGTYGNLFRSMGLAEDKSAEMSTSLVQLAADLASFNNIDPALALEKLRAGLVGETEPLKSLGVNLNQAAIEAKAMELGLVGAGGELTAAAKAQAAYAIIMDQTRLAQGDFARTSEGLANQQRILRATFGDLRATIGSAVLPVVNKLLGHFLSLLNSEPVQGFIKRLTDGLARLGETAGRVVDLLAAGNIRGALELAFGPEVGGRIAGIAETLGRFITQQVIPFVQAHGPELKGALTGIAIALGIAAVAAGVMAISISPLTAICMVIIAVAALLGAAWAGNWGGIQDKTRAVVEFITGLVNGFLAWIQGAWQTAMDVLGVISQLFSLAQQGRWEEFGRQLRVIVDKLWADIKAAFSEARERLSEIIRDAVDRVKGWFTNTDWGAVGRAIIDGIVGGVRAVAGRLGEAARDAANAAIGAAKGFLGIHSPSTLAAATIGRPFVEGIIAGIRAAGRELPRAVDLAVRPMVSAPAGGRPVAAVTHQQTVIIEDRAAMALFLYNQRDERLRRLAEAF